MKAFPTSLLLVVLLFPATRLSGYSVLAHEAIVDSVWNESIVKLLRQRFPSATAEELKAAHAYAYGGCLIQDLGYYPFGSHLFTDITHYVRSGDFVAAMLRDSRDLNEYAFALGALAHYAADNIGHPVATNRAVPILYPKLQRKYGNEVSYEDDPAAHLKTEFGFDVLQVARGRYASDAYRDFIGFEVSKPLLDRAFQHTYALELKDVFRAVDLAIGSYRRSVSSIIPKMTKVAWEIKHDEIQKSVPGITREKFLYNLSRSAYEMKWGKDYREPGFTTHLMGFLFRIIPKIGPFRALRFRTPTPEAEKLFLNSFNLTVNQYSSLLSVEASGQTRLPNKNLDLGKDTAPGIYELADKTYADLIDKLAARQFAGVSADLRNDILTFYRDGVRATALRNPQQASRLSREIELLRAAADSSAQ